MIPQPASPPTLRIAQEPPTFAWLIRLNGPQRGEIYAIPGAGLTIGRAPDNDLVLEDETVSRHHARLLVESSLGRAQVYIQDLASINGVLVNGQSVVRHLLEDEDRVLVGETLFVFKQL